MHARWADEPSAPKLALAIRHVHFEDCGSLVDVLLERNFAIRYIDVGRHALRDIDVSTADLVIALGGPVGVYEVDRYPWIAAELALLERCLALSKPVIGICLGAQMLAKALDAAVYPAPVKELGWKPLILTPEGGDSVIAPLAEEGASMLHWHGDTFDLPRGAKLLASTDEVRNQIFQWERSAIGFQCHPEIQAQDFERWLIGHAHEIGATASTSVARLRQDTALHGPALQERARRVFDDWLAGVA